MAECVIFPRVPEDIMRRFPPMRDYDRAIQRYAMDLCASIPAEANLGPIQETLRMLTEGLMAALGRIDVLEEQLRQISGEVRWETVTGNYDLSEHGVGLLVDSSGGEVVITLPKGEGFVGETVVIKDAGGMSGTNNITLVAHAGDTIDEEAELVIDSDGAGVQLMGTTEGWKIV